jgi:hypothetical protein
VLGEQPISMPTSSGVKVQAKRHRLDDAGFSRARGLSQHGQTA